MDNSNLSPAEVARYAPQISLEGWGREAQERVKSCRALIAGAGGLGSAAALYLLAGGVGAIRLVDHRRVSLADLGHQVLYREQDLGKAKATAAQRRLQELNSFALVEAQVKSLSPHNILRLASGCQVLLDATNNAAAGLILNQAAVKLRLPLLHARVWRLYGRLATFWPGQGPCLACSPLEAVGEGSSFFLSPLPGIIGALLALESLRLLGGLAPALLGRILLFDGNDFQFKIALLRANPECPSCQVLGRLKPGVKESEILTPTSSGGGVP
jgi:molybdopterin/thiamine biosynthesis adenylyltransferase